MLIESFGAFEKTAKFALRKAISISPATSEWRPEEINVAIRIFGRYTASYDHICDLYGHWS